MRTDHEAARLNKQREIEWQKAQEERENERRARVLAEERYKCVTKVSPVTRFSQSLGFPVTRV